MSVGALRGPGDAPPIDRALALRIINSLRQGSNLLDAAAHFSAGRDSLIAAAAELMQELTFSTGSAVRWLKGSYGTGKTHMFARLREAAHKQQWVVSYIEVTGKGQGCELHRFEEVYSEVVKGLVPGGRAAHEPNEHSHGWRVILDEWVEALRRQAGAHSHGDVPFMKYKDTLAVTMSALRRHHGVNGAFGAALKEYAVAALDRDPEYMELLLDWFTGVDVLKLGPDVRKRLRERGIDQVIARRNAKGMLRQMTAFLRYRGYKGVLVLLDEVENVLLLPPSLRRAAYTIMRELIDNVDATHGMSQTLLYFSATPDLFDSAKGIAEYEALASRVLLPAQGTKPNPAATVLDLELFPITRTDRLVMANRIMAIFEIAKGGELPANTGVQTRFETLADAAAAAAPRFWVRQVVEELDRQVS